MPTHYEIRPDHGYVHVWYTGNVSASEIRNMFRSFQVSPDFDPAQPHLVDLSRFVGTDAGFTDFFSIFSMFSRAYADSETGFRCAIYAPDDASFALARIFENLAETSDVVSARLFDDLALAVDWVAAQPDPV